MSELALIGLDWGTTSVRAMGFDPSGRVIAQARSAAGISSQHDGPAGYRRTFDELVSGWDTAEAPVLLCGMVGSDRGWVEAPYQPVPCDLRHTVPLVELDLPGHRAAVVPGLCQTQWPFGVIRGEETQVLGAVASGADIVIAPGSHSKWIRVDGRTVIDFVTFLTGETYAALSSATILSRTIRTAAIPGAGASAAFADGVATALRPGSLGPLSDVFAVRSLVLAGALGDTEAADFLSGILIGAEVRAARAWCPHPETDALALCCDDELARRYRVALEAAGFAAPLVIPDSAARGLWEIATSRGFI